MFQEIRHHGVLECPSTGEVQVVNGKADVRALAIKKFSLEECVFLQGKLSRLRACVKESWYVLAESVAVRNSKALSEKPCESPSSVRLDLENSDSRRSICPNLQAKFTWKVAKLVEGGRGNRSFHINNKHLENYARRKLVLLIAL